MTKPTFQTYIDFVNSTDLENNPRRVIVFHHGDMDGYMGAAAALRGFHSFCIDGNYAVSKGHQNLLQNIIFKEVNYGRIDDEEILNMIHQPGTDVFMVDFSFLEDLCEKIYAKADFFLILDHHISSERVLKGKPYAYFDPQASGAKMAFEYFSPGVEVPLAVQLVDNRDLWKKDTGWEDEFHEALYARFVRAKEQGENYNQAFVSELFTDYLQYPADPLGMVHKMIRTGTPMVERRDIGIRSMCSDKRLIETIIGGHPAIAVNAPLDQSDAGEYLYNQDKYKNHIIALFNVLNDKMTFSLRRNENLDIDLSALAQKHYGGGGHSPAAGFAVPLYRGLNIIQNKEKWALCWPTAAVKQAMGAADLAQVAQDLSVITPELHSRAVCETNLDLLQILPYIVIKHTDGTYFTYNRPSSGTESRLHGNDSVGLGGHVDTAPAAGVSIGLHLGLEAQRELMEEVGFSDESLPTQIEQAFYNGQFALINVNTRPVDAVHLGIVFVVEVTDKAHLTKIEESEVINPRWSTLEELRNLPNPETWTRIFAHELLQNPM
jgi:predicted NUDIX family phosphoesterase/oligoribonuclease NrnB/cAMP/cGMP phosphodiesterase (DHH superfamily)